MAKSTPTSPSTDITLVRSHPTNPINVTGQELPIPFIAVCAPRHISVRGHASHRIELGAKLLMPDGVVAVAYPKAEDAHMRGYILSAGVIHSGDEVAVFIRSLTPRAVEWNEGDEVARLYFFRADAMTVGFATDLT